MDYLDMLDYRPCSGLSRLRHSAALSLELALQPLREIAGRHRQQLSLPYVKEQTLRRWLENIYSTVQGKLFSIYFRPALVGEHNLPDGGALLVSNHSGMWGWDGIALQYAVLRETGRTVVGLAHRIFDGSDFAKSLGMATGSKENARKLLDDDRLVLVCPGGGREAVKPYSQRYKVQRVAGFARGNYGYLLTALEAKRPIIPVGIVGAEETHLILRNIKPGLDKVVDALYSSLPGPVKEKAGPYKKRWDSAKVFPLMLNMIPFPSKIEVRIGKPLCLSSKPFPAGYFRQLKELKRNYILSAVHERDYCLLERQLHSMNEDVLDAIQELLTPCFSAPIMEERSPLLYSAENRVAALRVAPMSSRSGPTRGMSLTGNVGHQRKQDGAEPGGNRA